MATHDTFKLYRRMFTYLRPYLFWFFLSILLSVFIVAFETISLWFSAPLIKTLFMPENTAAVKPPFSLRNLYDILKYYTYTFIEQRDALTSLKLVCALMLGAFGTKNLLIYVNHVLLAKLNLAIVRDMRDHLYRHTLRLPVTYYDRSRAGDIISLIINDVSAINASMTQTFDKLLVEPLRVVFFVVMLFAISARLSCAVFVVFPILTFLVSKIGIAVRRRSKRMLENFAGILSILHETMAGIRTVKMFNMNDVETVKFQKENRKFADSAFRSTRISQMSSPLIETLGVVIAVVLLWYGGQQVLSGKGIGAEDFILFLIYLYSTFKPLKALTSINNSLQAGFAAAERVFGILDTTTENLHAFEPSRVPAFNSDITFSHVRFAYPGCDDEVLKDINFTIKKGHIVALVGSSGSGKSTVLDLIPRFYEISAGTVTIDNNDIRQLDLVGLRHLFGIVDQETVLFNETVFNNIAYGVGHASETDVINAATAANAWEFIEKLPEGLQTIIGERGVMLSGGQRQRLAIARALLINPPILILDEATSSLDTESERLVQKAINNLMVNRTALIVAHRLSTIRHADQILVIENGAVAEQGTHEELYALDKRYRYFYDIQFSAGNRSA